MRRLGNNTPLAKRFEVWTKTDKTTGCRIWTGSVDKDGYGNISVNKRRRLAHRVAFEMAHGPIPSGKCVLHTCDTPGCVNPDHMRLGTRGDNNADRASKGRSANVKGVLHPMSKLTETDVMTIRASSKTYAELAEAYGVTKACILSVLRRRTWKHI